MLKRFLLVAAIGCLTAVIAMAQQQVLLGPNGEVIPLRQGDDVSKVAFKHHLTDVNKVASTLACPTTLTVGNNTGNAGGFTFNNGDTWLVKFVAPFAGNISQVWFRSNSGAGSAADTVAIVRIFASNIHPTSVGTTSTEWLGFYRYPGDPTGVGNTPWKDVTTDTNFVVGTPGAQDPNGPEIWGLGGYTTTWPNAAVNNKVGMMAALSYEPSVVKGDTFNVNIMVPPQSASGNAEIAQIAENNANPQGSFWKYYFRSRGVTPGDTGWYSRNSYNMRLWVVLTATGDLPPQIVSPTVVHNTFDTGPQSVSLMSYDCNAANPADTGVASAAVVYSTDNGTTWTTVSLTGASGTWSGQIPGFTFPTIVKYYFTATDIHSNISQTNAVTYQCLSLSQNGVGISTPAFSFTDITSTGTKVPSFYDTRANNRATNDDDGTAGPFDMGGNMTLWDSTGRFLYIGVNGAVSLLGSTNTADTIDVNSAGFYSAFSIPGTGLPRNFIGLLWNDLYLSGAGGAGDVYTLATGNQFIIEWAGVANFVDTSKATFEAIFDRTDNSVTVNYQSLGTAGLGLSGLEGVQVDNVSHFATANAAGYPISTQPADGFTLKMVFPVTGVNEPATKPRVFALNQNYPNPFNPSTKISYSIPTASNVTLTVFNVLGQKVATLVDGYKAPGDYTVDFAPAKLASGVYFYSLKAGQYSSVKKMVLMK